MDIKNNDNDSINSNNSSDDKTTSTCSSDEALCDVLGLASLKGMVMEEEDESPPPTATATATATTTTTTTITKTSTTRIRLPITASRGVSRKYYPAEDCFAYEIPHVLSREECRQLISVAANSNVNANANTNHSTEEDPSKPKPTPATTSFRYITHAVHTAPDGRTKFEVKLERPNPHKLAVFRHESWTNILWSRLRPLLVASAEEEDGDDDTGTDNDNDQTDLRDALKRFVRRELGVAFEQASASTSTRMGLNPRLRVLKYDASDRDEFRGHFDATTESGTGSTSYITVLLYLNDGGGNNNDDSDRDFGGGETEFLSQHEHEHSNSINGTAKIIPMAGSVVLFEHDLFHRGCPLLWGTKYVLRTDIVFADRANADSNATADPDESKPPPLSPVVSSSPATTSDAPLPQLSTVEDVLRRMEQDVRHWQTQTQTQTQTPNNCNNTSSIDTSIHDDDDHDSSTTATTATATTTTTKTMATTFELLRDALSNGMGFGIDLNNTTIECLCSPGRFPLNLMLREHLALTTATTTTTNPPSARQQQQDQSGTIDRFLDAAFDALRQANQ
uniref:Fe2OG dioxygenase domain-containing protein n=1 Tax=Pseudo-nitzschia australis TaxID=44445 RepID=A0A7S4AML0_9STRA